VLDSLSGKIDVIPGGPPPDLNAITPLIAALSAIGEDESKDSTTSRDTSTSTEKSTESSSSESSSSTSSSSKSSRSSSSRASSSKSSSSHSSSSKSSRSSSSKFSSSYRSSSSSSSSSGACPTHVYPDDPIEDWNGVPDPSIGGSKAKRECIRSGRPESQPSLEKRAGRKYTEIDGCIFPEDTWNSYPPFANIKSFRSFGKQPPRPNNKQMYDMVPKWYVANYLYQAPGFQLWKTATTGPDGYPGALFTGALGPGITVQSLDHVCECRDASCRF